MAENFNILLSPLDDAGLPSCGLSGVSIGGAEQAPAPSEERSAEVRGAPLGSYTESSSPPLHAKCHETAMRWGFRGLKYDLKNDIRQVIFGHYGVTKGQVVDFDEYNKMPRVVKCSRTRVSPEVPVYKSTEFGTCFYGGLTFCGSPWACPVCSAKIQARRRIEIEQAIKHQQLKGLKPVFITFTFPHYDYQSCSELLEIQKLMLRDLRRGSVWQRFKDRVGFSGLIRSLEVTYGGNGWHPHTHELWFVNSDYNENDIHDFVSKRWYKIAKKYNLVKRGKSMAFKQHAVQIGFSKSDYLAKFDDDKYVKKLSAEVSLSGVKSGRNGSLHPFQLAQLAHGDGKPNIKARDLFIEYIEAFKGKAQLYWSPGLKKECLVDDLTDQEIAEQKQEKAEKVTAFEMFGWNQVLKENKQSYILCLAEMSGAEDIENWLRSRNLSSYSEW